jgi:hypothetical protein
MNGVQAFNKHAANPKILEFIEANPETVTQKISVGFNEPDDPETKLYYGLSMTGPNLEKWHGKALELKQELFGDKEFHGVDNILLYAKFEL